MSTRLQHTVKQPCIYLLHYCEISLLILSSQETLKTPRPCCFIPQMTSLLMRNSSSLNQSHSRACPLVFKQWPDQTKVFSWSLMACCFVALVFYFGHVTKAFRCPCHHCYHLVSKDTQAMSPLTGLVFFIYDFGQPNFYFCLSRNIIWLHFGLVEQNLGQSLLSFSAWIYSFIVYQIAWNNPSCLVGFCVAKASFLYLSQ